MEALLTPCHPRSVSASRILRRRFGIQRRRGMTPFPCEERFFPNPLSVRIRRYPKNAFKIRPRSRKNRLSKQRPRGIRLDGRGSRKRIRVRRIPLGIPNRTDGKGRVRPRRKRRHVTSPSGNREDTPQRRRKSVSVKKSRPHVRYRTGRDFFTP